MERLLEGRTKDLIFLPGPTAGGDTRQNFIGGLGKGWLGSLRNHTGLLYPLEEGVSFSEPKI